MSDEPARSEAGDAYVQSPDGQPEGQAGGQQTGTALTVGAAVPASATDHPEIELAAAFAAGVLLARLLTRLARGSE